MKYFIIVCFQFFCLNLLFAQQEQQYSQYMLNPFTINPAVAGTEDFIDVQLGYRSQWSGFDGSPKTAYLTTHATVGKPYHQYHNKTEHTNWHGIGLNVYDDRTGPIQRNAYLLAYAYNMGITKKTRLSVGTYVGFKQLKTNADYWENIDDESDFIFSADLNSGLQPELQLGMVLYNKGYYVMASVQNLFGQKIEYSKEDGSNEDAAYQQHAFLTAGIKIPLTESVNLTPSTMMKYTPNAPLSVDLSLKVDHNSMFWYGASARTVESLYAFAGVQIKKEVDISYAFEWSLSKIRKYNSGTHEIIIGLRLKHPKNITCPSKYW